ILEEDRLRDYASNLCSKNRHCLDIWCSFWMLDPSLAEKFLWHNAAKDLPSLDGKLTGNLKRIEIGDANSLWSLQGIELITGDDWRWEGLCGREVRRANCSVHSWNQRATD